VLNQLVDTSYSKEDVVILLQDVKGRVPVLDTEEREKLNQSGVHYSEMLPLEYRPTEKYMEIYQESLDTLSSETANAIELLCEKLIAKKGKDIVIVSLARAGTPVGILAKRYIKFKWGYDVPHYSISIIRGKGIDVAAMNYIVDKHGVNGIQFLDGWVGKGAINGVLDKACKELEESDSKFIGLDSELAVLSDPASVTDLYGTRQDFLIPSACLNATVSGLVSRTVKLKSMTDNELHGAVYYGEYENEDKSIEFIDKVCSYFTKDIVNHFSPSIAEQDESFKGIDEVRGIGAVYGIEDVNKIKPGVGETTRVLLRRLPDRILMRKGADDKYLKHIKRLCEEKNVPIEYYNLKKYNVCGIIKEVADL
jgi:hypothetical protein